MSFGGNGFLQLSKRPATWAPNTVFPNQGSLMKVHSAKRAGTARFIKDQIPLAIVVLVVLGLWTLVKWVNG